MKRKYLIYLFIVIPYLGFSQKKGGEVVYKVVMVEDSVTKSSLRPRLKERYEMAESKIADLKPSLVFNDSLAVFAKNLSKYRNDEIFSFALKLIDCEKVIYTNTLSGENIFNSVEKKAIFKENEFLISKKLEENWVLTDESKMIQNFKCFKATLQISLKNDYGTFYRTLIAWYCPEIPYSFGPKGYTGLPGLILELQDRNVVFGVESLRLFEENVKIDLPTKGKSISFDEYETILRERVYKRMGPSSQTMTATRWIPLHLR